MPVYEIQSDTEVADISGSESENENGQESGSESDQDNVLYSIRYGGRFVNIVDEWRIRVCGQWVNVFIAEDGRRFEAFSDIDDNSGFLTCGSIANNREAVAFAETLYIRLHGSLPA